MLCLWTILPYKADWIPTGIYLLLIFMLLGMMNTSYQSKPQGPNHIYNFKEKPGFLTGKVLDTVNRSDGNYQELLLAAHSFEEKEQTYQVKGKVLLRIYENETSFQYGDLLKARVALEEPALPGNFGEYNYRDYLVRQKLFIIGNLKAEQVYLIGRSNKLSLSKTFKAIKDSINKNINIIYHFPQNALIKAIITGDRSELPPMWNTIFRDAGVMHILAISGLHVGIIAAFLFFFFNICPFFKNNKKISYLMTISFLIAYATLTGFRPSVSRAALMFIIFLMAKYVNRPYHQYSSIYLTALVLLFFQPFLLFDVGFLLSFTVTFFIILLYPLFTEKLRFFPDFLSKPLAISLAAWFGTAPLSAFYFYQISFISILANLIIVPLISIILIFGLITIVSSFILLPFAVILARLNEFLIGLLLFCTRFFSSLPYAYNYVGQPPICLTVSYYILIIIMAYIFTNWSKLDFKNRRNVFWTITAIAMTTVFIQFLPFSKPLSVHFINVGQGDSILIQTPQKKNILIDGGGTPFTNFDVGKHIVIPYLRRLGIDRIDLLVLTHPDLDHLEGLVTVLKEMKVNMVVDSGVENREIVYQEFLSLVKRDALIAYHKVRAGDLIALEPDLEILVFNPPNLSTYSEGSNSNNHSIVLKLLYKTASFLFTGDIEESAEINLLSWKNQLRSDILKVAHHGSITSSSESFLSSVQPQAAVISVGLNNFNHPHPNVVKRLKEQCQEVFRTDLNGTVHITSNGQNYKIKTLR